MSKVVFETDETPVSYLQHIGKYPIFTSLERGKPQLGYWSVVERNGNYVYIEEKPDSYFSTKISKEEYDNMSKEIAVSLM
jgi:hypothetical protein